MNDCAAEAVRVNESAAKVMQAIQNEGHRCCHASDNEGRCSPE